MPPWQLCKQGRLGIQHPWPAAIPACFLTVKRDIQYVTEGVWTSNHTHTPSLLLNTCGPSTRKGWDHNSLSSLIPFQEYYSDFKAICASEQMPDQDPFHAAIASLNKCKDAMRTVVSKHIKILVSHALRTNQDINYCLFALGYFCNCS